LIRDGLVVFAKRACETCVLVENEMRRASRELPGFRIISQDDPQFPSGVPDVVDDRELDWSWAHRIEIMPTLLRFVRGEEVERVEGWDRAGWQRLTGIADIGAGLPLQRPGCGSLSTQPGIFEKLEARHSGATWLAARKVEYGDNIDPVEVCYERGWTDGLPVTPPTDQRVIAMLKGTSRKPDDIVGGIPPNLADCTVEKVAINAVMAGCRPEYMPVLLAAIEAALEPVFTLHGVLATTYFSGPVIIVNGPVVKRIGMNSGINALGQGNRANATIGEVDRATLGSPSKYTMCFAEDESDPAWQPLAQARGIRPGVSAVTLFQGHGPEAFVDQKSRTAEALTKSFAMSLVKIGHPKLVQAARAIVVLSPEHYGIYREAGWDRARIERAMYEATIRPGAELVAGADGVGEGIPASRAGEQVPKFHEDALMVVRAGGAAGLFSAILPGWLAGRSRTELQPVTKEITE
jgi:hypothetical protein